MVERLDALEQWLLEAQRRGYLGPGPVDALVAHSLGFADVIEALVPTAPAGVLDLGSGGGVPGLILAARWSEAKVTLVEGSVRRAAFLTEAGEDLGWISEGRVRVIARRAEEVGRDPGWRERFEVVVARSFGPPAVTAECAAPLLQVEGWLVVSEPPAAPAGGLAAALLSEDRWPTVGVAQVGLSPVELRRGRGSGFQVLRKVSPTPDRYPRRVGIPTKRPLY